MPTDTNGGGIHLIREPSHEIQGRIAAGLDPVIHDTTADELLNVVVDNLPTLRRLSPFDESAPILPEYHADTIGGLSACAAADLQGASANDIIEPIFRATIQQYA